MAQVMPEEWRPVVGWEGKYWVSSFGNVRGKRKLLRQWVSPLGYCVVSLEKGSRKGSDRESKFANVHRLVAMAFVPNPNNLPQVNHIDENPSNNHANNLEWCTAKYNMNYGEGARTRHSKIDYTVPHFKDFGKRMQLIASLPVAQMTMSGDVVKVYPSDMEASRCTNIDRAHINAVVNNKRRSAGGYKWIRWERNTI